MKFSLTARAYIALVVIAGLAVLGYAVFRANAIYAARFVAFLLAACVAARLKVKLPGLTGSMSVNLPFILVATAEMSLVESLIVGCVSNLVQYLPREKQKFNWVQALFNFNTMALAVGAARWLYETTAIVAWAPSPSLRLGVAAAGFFVVNTVPVAMILFLAEGKNLVRTWIEIFELTFVYFLASASIAGVALTLTERVGWQVPISILPLMLGVFYSYRRYFVPQREASSDSARKPVQSEQAVPVGSEARAQSIQ